MKIKYNLTIPDDTIHVFLKKVINQTYKLLPMREEGRNWEKPL